MADWIMWLIAAGVVVILELFTGTFYLLMVAIGMAAGAAVAAAGLGPNLQLGAAAVVGALATMLLRRSRFGTRPRTDSARDPNINMDVGQSINVPEWTDGVARVMYRGAQWDVELAPGSTAEAGKFTIREVRGSRLVVANA